jgi:hypothetical protein
VLVTTGPRHEDAVDDAVGPGEPERAAEEHVHRRHVRPPERADVDEVTTAERVDVELPI